LRTHPVRVEHEERAVSVRQLAGAAEIRPTDRAIVGKAGDDGRDTAAMGGEPPLQPLEITLGESDEIPLQARGTAVS
jgi:hypothetical protein